VNDDTEDGVTPRVACICTYDQLVGSFGNGNDVE